MHPRRGCYLDLLTAMVRDNNDTLSQSMGLAPGARRESCKVILSDYGYNDRCAISIGTQICYPRKRLAAGVAQREASYFSPCFTPIDEAQFWCCLRVVQILTTTSQTDCIVSDTTKGRPGTHGMKYQKPKKPPGLPSNIKSTRQGLAHDSQPHASVTLTVFLATWFRFCL